MNEEYSRGYTAGHADGEKCAHATPTPMLLWCPACGKRHYDVGEFATKAHHTHACQECGLVWRPAVIPTIGVHFLPGFQNAPPQPSTGGPK